jgi:Fe-S oxidoreductase
MTIKAEGNMEELRFFDPEKCDLCGNCLHHCPVLNLSLEEAKSQIRNLIEGKDMDYVLTRCTSCFTCNTLCTQKINPYELILSRWEQRYRRRGLRGVARLVVPNQPMNVWSGLRRVLPADEREIIKGWSDTSPGDEILYPGGMTSLFPYLTHTRLLKGLRLRGSEEFWLGGALYYQLGLFDVVERIGRLLQKRFGQIKPKRVIPFYVAEYIMLKEIYPKRFDIHFDFEVESFERWLWERIEGGEIKIRKKIARTVTLQDSCWSKAAGADFFDLTRRIVEITGADLSEMEHNREQALCCGFGGGAGRFSPGDILRATLKRLREVEETRAQALVVHCTGCLFILSLGLRLKRSSFPIYHLLEMLQEATGEKPIHRHQQRAGQLLRVMFRSALSHPGQLARRFRIEDIS